MRLISQASISQACASRLDLPPPSVLPAHPDSPLTGVFLRLLIEVRHQAPLSTTTTAAPLPPEAPLAANTGAHYVISTDTASRFPLIRVNHRTIKQTILRFLKLIFSGLGYEVTTRPTTSPNHLLWSPNSTAVLGVEFAGTPRKAVQPTDGFCLTLFLSLSPPPREPFLGSTAATNQHQVLPSWQSQTTCALATGFLLCRLWRASGNIIVSLSERDKSLLFSLLDLRAGTCCRISLPT
uniref:8-oxo-dGDP phosphatase NUDT18 n=2 Tax=Schistocephalus solidus TaxID=70667 RepID=A0A0V0J4G0_SCHSO